MDHPYSKDMQVTAIRGARTYLADRITRVAAPHRLLDPDAGEPLPGLYSAGEVAGFGGGGMHGYRALEGTFLGGCIFSGRTAGRAAAAAVR